jgi:hypothetical protein
MRAQTARHTSPPIAKDGKDDGHAASDGVNPVEFRGIRNKQQLLSTGRRHARQRCTMGVHRCACARRMLQRPCFLWVGVAKARSSVRSTLRFIWWWWWNRDVMWIVVMYAGGVAQGAAETATAHGRHSVRTRRRLLYAGLEVRTVMAACDARPTASGTPLSDHAYSTIKAASSNHQDCRCSRVACCTLTPRSAKTQERAPTCSCAYHERDPVLMECTQPLVPTDHSRTLEFAAPHTHTHPQTTLQTVWGGVQSPCHSSRRTKTRPWRRVGAGWTTRLRTRGRQRPQQPLHEWRRSRAKLETFESI